MKCVSCETEINPKWKHAIDMNVCPFCGKHIMEEHLKNLLTSLRETMDKLTEYQPQLDDFLLSNYDYIKTDSPDLKMFLPKDVIKEMRKEIDDAEFQEKKRSIVRIKTQDEDGNIVEQDVEVEKTMSDNRTQTFHDRANNMLKQEKAVDGEPKSVAEKTKNLRNTADEIRKKLARDQEAGGVASMISRENMAEADPEAVAEFQQVIGTGDIVASSLPPTADGDDEEIPGASVVQAMISMKGNKGADGGPNAKDLDALARMQAKVQGGAKRLSSGKGSFSRG
jgi:hypothetical protein